VRGGRAGILPVRHLYVWALGNATRTVVQELAKRLAERFYVSCQKVASGEGANSVRHADGGRWQSRGCESAVCWNERKWISPKSDSRVMAGNKLSLEFA
jgi:hypothetical protein